MNMIGVFILFTKYIFLFLEGKILTVLVIFFGVQMLFQIADIDDY